MNEKIEQIIEEKDNSEVARFIIKQISKIPISKLILDFTGKAPDSIKRRKSTKKEV